MLRHSAAFVRSVFVAAALVGSTALVPAATAQTLEEALASAYANNPQLLASRAQLRATDERVAQARAGWRPTVTLSGTAGYSRTERQNVANDPTELQPRTATLSVSQPLFRGFRTTYGTQRARNEVQAERARMFSVEAQIFLDVATAYLNVLRDAAVLELTSSNEAVLTRQLSATNDRFRVGEVTRTDVSQAESRVAGARADRIAAAGQLQTSTQAYERLLGASPRGLVAPAIPGGLPTSQDEAQSAAMASNPIVLAAQFDEAASREAIDEVRGELLPSVNLVGELVQQREVQIGGSQTNIARATVQVSVPLYEAGSVYSRVRAQRQTNSQRQIQIEQQRRVAAESAAVAYQQLNTARARLVSLAAQIRATEIALEGVRQEAAVGSRTVLDVLNAEQELLNAQVSYVRSQRDELVAAYTVLGAVGQLGARQLQLPVELYDFEANYRDVEGRWIGTDANTIPPPPRR